MKAELHCNLWNKFNTSVHIIPFFAFRYEISRKEDLHCIFLTLVKVNDWNPLKRMNWFSILHFFCKSNFFKNTAGIFKYFKAIFIVGLNVGGKIRFHVLFLVFLLQLQSAEKLKWGLEWTMLQVTEVNQLPGQVFVSEVFIICYIFTATLFLCCRFIRP